MKFIHLADLHLGRSIGGFFLLEDQEYILKQILDIIRAEKIEGVLICGDIYDKTSPLAEAVGLFDDFVTALAALNLPVFVISGNHDSAKKLSFAYRLVEKCGLYLAPVFTGAISTVTLTDEYGPINIHMLPFLKPATAKEFFPEDEIRTHHDAVRCALAALETDPHERHILLAHQFITGALSTDEESSVGGADNIGIEIFTDFDYVALGHLHAPQKLKYDYIRYSGSPLKYSPAEIKQEKSVTIVDLKEKGNIAIKIIPLMPLRDMREIKGSYDELCQRENYQSTTTDDYLKVVLTDENDVINALAKLRTIYPHILELSYANKRTLMQENSFAQSEQMLEKTPLEHFNDLYFKQNNRELDSAQRQYLTELINKLWEAEQCGR